MVVVVSSTNNVYSDWLLQTKNQTYITNLQKLKNFVMVMFTEDTMVQPKESEVRD